MATEDGFKIEVVGMEPLVKKLNRSQTENLIALNNGLREIGRFMVPAVKAVTPKGARGRLRGRTFFEIKGKGQDMEMKIVQPAKSGMGYFYGGAVRGGTRPHFPPPSALYDWVMVKLGIPMPAARGVAFLIARKISEVGTKPQPYQKEALKANMQKIQTVVNRIGQKIAIKIAQP